MQERFEMAVLVVFAWIVKLLFLLYRAIPFSLPFGALLFLVKRYWFAQQPDCIFWYLTVAAAVFMAIVTQKHQYTKDNPYRAYIGWYGRLEKMADGLIAWIGTVKYFTSPLGLVEDPGSYRIRGEDVRSLIDSELRPGDILLRGFDGYLDGLMMKFTGGGEGMGMNFSHAALYLGDLNDTRDKPIVARRLQVLDDKGLWVEATPDQQNAVRDDEKYYKEGRQKVVHSMTRGVFVEDILTFLRCDYLAVLRLPQTFRLSPQERAEDHSLIANLAPDAENIRQMLLNGQAVTSAEVLEAVHLSALGKIGSCYDFQFNDAKTHQRFSCSEYVYYCFKSVHCYIGLELKKHAFLKIFFPRTTITPSDIYDAAIRHKKLDVIWPR